MSQQPVSNTPASNVITLNGTFPVDRFCGAYLLASSGDVTLTTLPSTDGEKPKYFSLLLTPLAPGSILRIEEYPATSGVTSILFKIGCLFSTNDELCGYLFYSELTTFNFMHGLSSCSSNFLVGDQSWRDEDFLLFIRNKHFAIHGLPNVINVAFTGTIDQNLDEATKL